MKVIILAAGVGKRFRALNLPKPLTTLENGQTLLGSQIELLSHEISIHDILVIVGYRKEKIMEQFPNLLFVYNPDFAKENTSKSLLKALYKIDDDVLWINGDVVFRPKVLKAILDLKKTCMVVNKSPVSDEEVKYRANKQGQILEVSKEVLNPHGEALGINFFTKQDVKELRENLIKCQDQDYFEKGIELCIADGMAVWTVPVEIDDCAEVDFPEDLKKANQVVSKEV